MTESDSQNTSIPSGALLQIANNILDLLEYNSELNEEDDLFSDQFYIIIVGHLVTDDKFEIKPGETQEEQVDALDRLISFLGHIIDKDLSIISAEGIITEHDRVSTKLLLELIEELIKALKNENENEENEEQSDEQAQRAHEGRDIKRKEESNESLSINKSDSGNYSIEQRANISDRDMVRKRRNMIDEPEDEVESIELPGEKAKRLKREKEAKEQQKKMKEQQQQQQQQQKQQQKQKEKQRHIEYDDSNEQQEEEEDNENEKIQTDDMHANYTEDNIYTTSNNNNDIPHKNINDNNNEQSPQSLKDIETNNEINALQHSNTNNNSSGKKPSHKQHIHSNSDEQNLHRNPAENQEEESNNSLAMDLRNRSCFEALEYEKMLKIRNGEYDESLIRKTLTENDLSRFERVLIENGEDEEQESEQHEHNYPMGIDYEEAGHNLHNETPVMNVSHISEVSKSKENSEHQGKLNSKSRKNESIDRKKEAIVMAKQQQGQGKGQSKGQTQGKAQAQGQAQGQGRRQDESNEPHSLLDDDNNQSHPSSYYINNRKNDSRDIDYNQNISDSYDQDQEDYRNMTGGNSNHSVPQARTKFKLNSSSNNSSSYKQQEQPQPKKKKSPMESSIEGSNNQSQSQNQSQSNKKPFNKSSAGSNSISNKPNTINNKLNSTNKASNHKNSKDTTKNQNRHSQSDISQSSLYSQSQNSQNRIAKSKSEHSNILEELPLSDSVLKYEIIKEFKKLYGNKLDKVFLQSNLQNSHDILQVILSKIKEARQKMLKPNEKPKDFDDHITKDFIRKYQKELQYIIDFYHKEKNKRTKFQEKALNTLSKNVKLMKKTQEIQTKKMEAEIERKRMTCDGNNNQQQQVRICNEIYSKALQLEKEKYLEEASNHMELRRRESDEKRRGMMEVEKYYTDKIAILKEILRREKKERNVEYKAKVQFLDRLGKERKGEFKRQIEQVFEKFDEEEKKEDMNDNNQEEIEKILTNYYQK